MWSALALCLLAPPVQDPPPAPAAAPRARAEGLVPVPDPEVWTTPGARVPPLELPLIDGSGAFDLGSLEGKRALLIQFASWSAGCRRHVPVWHELTKDLVAEGDLVVVGITQEQHPDRCRLFAQWRGCDFPILWDPFNLTGLEAVPVLTGIDEHGIVRLARPDPRRFQEQFVGEFLGGTFENDPAGQGPAAFRVGDAADPDSSSPQARCLELLLQRPDPPAPVDPALPAPIDLAVAGLRSASGSARGLFHAGVAVRMRHDGPHARPGDFQLASDLWHRALALRPDQSIWRRRIQQWGPRLDKPGAFYGWVETARAELRARGEEPWPLPVPLSGAEVAGRSRAVPVTPEAQVAPDPEGVLTRDAGALVAVDTAAVLHTAAAGGRIRTPRGASRVHVALRPRGGAKWAPDADRAELWLDLPEGWAAEARRVVFPAPDPEAPGARLAVDLEVSTPPVPLMPPEEGGGPPPTEAVLAGYAVYSVCLADGTCVFRRQDLSVRIQLPAPPSFGDGDGDGDGKEGDKGDDDR